MKNKPLVSIVIPTLNIEKIIGECLESVKNQTYSNIELIIVDDHSGDKTPEIARNYGAKVYSYGPDQDEAFGKVFGAPCQRNYGVQKAAGKYIYYVDSDMRLTPKVVEECVRLAENEDADAVVVPEIPYGEGFWSRCRVLEKMCYINDELIDAARFVRKEVWDSHGGLDLALGCRDDWDFQQRLNRGGYKTMNCKSYVRHYEGRLTLKKQIKKRFVYGQTIDKYFVRYSDDLATVLKQYSFIRPAFIRHWKKLLRDPVHTLGLFFMKTVEYFAAGAGLVYAKIKGD